MKIVIAGSRGISDIKEVQIAVVLSKFSGRITEVVSGGATGVDSLGEQWAIQNNIEIKKMPAEWSKLGRAAGPIRNVQMADYCDGAIIVWDGQSKGTLNMIKNIRDRKKPFFINVVV